MAYLRGLSKDHRITLVTFEKPQDAADEGAMAHARADCAAHGIRWLPQRFRARPRLIAPAWSMVLFLLLCLREVRRGNAALIHARSYLPAAVALVVKRLTGTPFLFDMRALWPEELITAGRLRRGSPVHRAIVRAERACLREAAGVVSLTHAAVDHLRKAYPAELANQRIVVIPTCADLDRFTPPETPPAGPPVYSCLGTITSGWFRPDMLAALFAELAARDGAARFEIITRDDPDQVRGFFEGMPGVLPRLEIRSLPPGDVPEALKRHSVSAMFFTEGLSKLGSSPTRLGEVLGCGVPVIANEGVGDVARIIEKHRVGVLMQGADRASARDALDRLDALRSDPNLPTRCRAAAERVFSLRQGTEDYRALYRDILRASAPTALMETAEPGPKEAPSPPDHRGAGHQQSGEAS